MFTLTGSFFPHHSGLGHAVGLTVDDQLSVPFDVRVRRFDSPFRRHCTSDGLVVKKKITTNNKRSRLVFERFRSGYTPHSTLITRSILEIPNYGGLIGAVFVRIRDVFAYLATNTRAAEFAYRNYCAAAAPLQ